MGRLRERRLVSSQLYGAQQRLTTLPAGHPDRTAQQRRVDDLLEQLTALGGPVIERGSGLWGASGPYATSTSPPRQRPAEFD